MYDLRLSDEDKYFLLRALHCFSMQLSRSSKSASSPDIKEIYERDLGRVSVLMSRVRSLEGV